MKKSYLAKLFIILFIGCLLLLSCLPHSHPGDGFMLPPVFVLIVFFAIITTIQAIAKAIIPKRTHYDRQFRAPPYPLF